MIQQPLVLPESLEPDAFRERIVSLKHRLHELPMFSDEGLLELIERHPRHALSICGMSDRSRGGWTEGELGELTAEQVLEALRVGRFWLNVRRIYEHQPAVRELVDRLYDELRLLDPDLRPTWKNATLLVSSPSAYVNFHVDVPCNLLWHIRGVKRVWIYPRDDERVVSASDLAATVAQQQTEMLPYDQAMDEHALCAEMRPGEMFSWPQNSPHRVDNVEGLNVSLSTEHLTGGARQRIRVLQANHYLRSTLGVPASDDRVETAAGRAKMLGATGYLAVRKLLRLRPRGKAGYPVTFRVEPTAPGARVELA